MSIIKIASICPRMGLSDPEGNMETLARWSRKAANAGADLALFPEIFITGYGEKFMYSAGYANRGRFLSLGELVPGPTTEKLVELSRDLGIFLCAGLLERDEDLRYNTQVMIDPVKGYLGCYRKIQVDISEQWFSEPGTNTPVFDVRGVPTGILICRDKSYPEVARMVALEGAQLLLAPHAATEQPSMGFRSWSLKICAVRAMENGCYLIADNNIYDCPMADDRCQAGYNFAIDPYGEVIHCDEGPGNTEKMALITVDTNKVRRRRELEGLSFNLWARRPEAYRRLLQQPGAPPDKPGPFSARSGRDT